MKKCQIEFEGDEITNLLKDIKDIQLCLDKIGIEWHTISCFVDDTNQFWRFDWEYLWTKCDDDLIKLLKEAIQAGKSLI